MFRHYSPGEIIADDVHLLSLLLLRAPLDELIRAVPHSATKTGGGKKRHKRFVMHRFHSSGSQSIIFCHYRSLVIDQNDFPHKISVLGVTVLNRII